MAGTAFLSANSFHGLAKETTRGSLPASGAIYIPVMTPAIVPNQVFLRDSAMRGSPVETYDMVQGVRHDELDAKYPLYADTFPNLLVAVLGSTDTVTGTGPYTHVIGLLNAPTTGSQPPSYSLLGFDGANYFTMTGAQAASLDIQFSSEQTADGTVKWIGNPYVSATTAPAPFGTLSLSTEAMVPGWSVGVTVGGTSFAYIASGNVMLERKTAPIFTAGTQAPYTNFAGPLVVTGKFTGLISTNADPWSTGSSATALTRSPQAVVVTFTDTNDQSVSVNHSIALTMTDVQFEKPKRTVGKEYTEIEVEFEARSNATDAISGYAPVKTTTINGTTAAYN
jgi:hypothetical protein